MNINIFKIIAEADIVVQLILLLLVFFSVFSWAIIFYKAKTIKSAVKQSERFLEAFRRSKSLTEVNDAAKKLRASPLAVIFLAGNKELAYQSKSTRRERLDRRRRPRASTGPCSRPRTPRSRAWRR